LGLYLSRRLLEAMGGGIEAIEAESGGAEVAFWLPLAVVRSPLP
jgi:signal transduction histidine kinase